MPGRECHAPTSTRWPARRLVGWRASSRRRSSDRRTPRVRPANRLRVAMAGPRSRAPRCPWPCPCRPVYEGGLTWQSCILAEPVPVQRPVRHDDCRRRGLTLHFEETREGATHVHQILPINERTLIKYVSAHL